ncbi:hypothetical protein LMG27177_06340 [Paraburkholderia fynbosensis]|uniref:Uncharacterized protein n=1 Tax=Paraburkholderia fynbosensis TaxID=1200993 RepID=A0A6J5GV07_9BURK|nr:hypothetical protein LMG27177_06340 [Paraburkholderia fynbosensis]
MRCGPHPVNPFDAIIFEKLRSAERKDFEGGGKLVSRPI